MTQIVLSFPLSLQHLFALSTLVFGLPVNPLVQIPQKSPFGHQIVGQEDPELSGSPHEPCQSLLAIHSA